MPVVRGCGYPMILQSHVLCAIPLARSAPWRCGSSDGHSLWGSLQQLDEPYRRKPRESGGSRRHNAGWDGCRYIGDDRRSKPSRLRLRGGRSQSCRLDCVNRGFGRTPFCKGGPADEVGCGLVRADITEVGMARGRKKGKRRNSPGTLAEANVLPEGNGRAGWNGAVRGPSGEHEQKQTRGTDMARRYFGTDGIRGLANQHPDDVGGGAEGRHGGRQGVPDRATIITATAS